MKRHYLNAIIGLTLLASFSMAVASELSSASIAVKMTAFEMPAEYNCPLFSNSPYTDMLTSLDKMQENLNRVLPECESKVAHTKLNEASTSLQQKVMEAQTQQKNGQTYKLSQTTSSIVDITKVLQQSLVAISSAKTKACYTSNSQFRNMIFSINDTFQSLSPLILDIATSNPALTATLGPSLKILAGADAVSKGLSLIEQIAKDSVQFDMTDKDNRVNTLKNTCQFMKLYNRLTYLRLSRLGQMQTVHAKFQADLTEMSHKVSAANQSRTKGGVEFVNATASIKISSDPSLELFEKLKISIPEEQSLIQKALGGFNQASTDYNFPEITQCQLVRTSFRSSTLKNLIGELKKFSKFTKNMAELQLDLEGINDYEVDLNKALAEDNRQLCSQLGKDWLTKMDALFLEARRMLAIYEAQLIELNGEEYLIKQRKIAKDAEKLKTTESDYKNLKAMITYASFESSEVEKRARGMHKYMFAGPDKVVSECSLRDADNKCGPVDAVAGLGKAFYQEWRNQGPVYELLLNNGKYFDESMTKLTKSMAVIERFEARFLPANLKAISESTDLKLFNQYTLARKKAAFQMDHLTAQYVVKGTNDYKDLCGNAKLIIAEYLKASTHMMATFGMCEMIQNVLHEPEVSKKLKNYCLPESETTASKLNQLRFRLAGQFDESSKKSELQVQLFQRSPKAFVDQLLKRIEALGCYTN